MKQKERIIELFGKLISGKASGAEKEKLFNYINSDGNKDIVYAWIKENWEHIDHGHLEISSQELLDRIHKQIGRQSSVTAHKGARIKRIVTATMKYAAVCVVACGIEWYVLSRQPGQKAIGDQFAQPLTYNEINVPAGSKSYIVLSDSTKVWLNAGAKFKYPGNFRQGARNVYLEGEAFFDVSKDKEKPFFVRVAGMDIKVLGTQFNVKAYADEEMIETTLLKGAIEVVGLRSDKQGEDNLRLSPGQKLVLFKNKNYKVEDVEDEATETGTGKQIIAPIQLKRAEVITLNDTEPEVSWKKDKLIFQKEPFKNVKIKLERWYGVSIEIQNPDILNYRFTGTFENETFELALSALKKAADFEYVIKKKHVIIK